MAMLADQAFRSAWNELYEACRFATIYQSVSFATTWYTVYHSTHEPVILFANQGERLRGLLLLSRDRSSGRLANAGEHHAEYQGWLALPEYPTFMVDALQLCRRSRVGTELRFHFLAPEAPLGWLELAKSQGIRTATQSHFRGLMRVGSTSSVGESLRKSANKSRLSRLSRIGPVRFQQLETREELETVFDKIIAQCDLRQGAIHEATPFQSDPQKREFYLSLMHRPGLLHASVLFAGEEVIAAHLGPQDRHYVSLGLLSYSPFHAAQSPGKLLILLLGRMLGEQGYSVFDLTPGHGYKERFATHHDEVPSLTVFLRWRSGARYRVRRTAVRLFKAAARAGGRDAHDLAAQIGTVSRRLHPGGLGKRIAAFPERLARWIASTQEFRLYRWDLSNWNSAEESAALLNVNRLEDLLVYQPATPTDPTRPAYFRMALARLEEGQIAFTYAADGLLLHSSWLIKSTTRVGSDLGHEIPLPEPSAVLWDDYTHPQARGRGFHTSSLRARIGYVARNQLAEVIVIGVRADNAPSRHNIEKLGFSYYCSAYLSTRFGTKTRWLV